jgi:hypothetical protein
VSIRFKNEQYGGLVEQSPVWGTIRHTGGGGAGT